MNVNGTLSTAVIRGAYQAAIQFGGTALITYQVSNNWNDSLVAGGVAAFLALGFRGVVEGLTDKTRQVSGDIQASDVQAGSAGKA